MITQVSCLRILVVGEIQKRFWSSVVRGTVVRIKELPGDPVVKTLNFRCRDAGCGFEPWVGADPMCWPAVWGDWKKKSEKQREED